MDPATRSEVLRRLKADLQQAATDLELLHRQIAQDRSESSHWEQRAERATAAGDLELAAAARERSAHHAHRAAMLEADLPAQEERVEALRQRVRNPDRDAPITPRLPPELEVDAAEQRLRTLEEETRLEEDLTELKRRRAPDAGAQWDQQRVSTDAEAAPGRRQTDAGQRAGLNQE